MKDDGGLLDAIDGKKGALDAWLEVHNESECRAAIKALASTQSAPRDWLAGQALNGFLVGGTKGDSPKSIAQSAYMMADAMLKERAISRSEEGGERG